jgi:hypothetical protein
MRSLLRTLAVVSVLLPSAACGGTASQHASPGANTAFVARAERSCVRARKQLDAVPAFPFHGVDAMHPDPRVLPAVGRFLTGRGNELPIVRRLERQLRALGDPPAKRAEWRRVLATLHDFEGVFAQEDQAALAADVPGWVKSVRANRQLPKRLAGATAGFGAKRCDVL